MSEPSPTPGRPASATPEVAPEVAPEADAEPSLAERLSDACIDLRSDLEVSRHIFRGVPHYVLRDPISFASHSFVLADYRILTALSSQQTLGEIFAELVSAGELEEEDSERFFQFVFSLHKLGFLALPISDEKTLYKRYESRRAAKRAAAAKSVLFFRVPLIDPDRFLERTLPYLRPLFGRTAFTVWCLAVGLALWVAARNWGEFMEPVGDIFSTGNLPVLWITLISLKVFHEFGHAYATKALGGRVPEMGLFFMIFTPCAYVDASASWGFSKKRERIFVCLAGMYVELFIAALCLMAWSVMPPGFARSVLHNAVMLSSVITIGFNINPLMRYDGYYALSDAVEIPNLRSRSQAYGLAVLKRVLLGVRSSQQQLSLGVRTFLLGFGVASALYKVTLVLGISATIAMKFPVIGLAFGGAYCLNEVFGVGKRALPYLWQSQETAAVRRWAMALSLILLGGIPLALVAIPVPSSVVTRAVVGTRDGVLLRAQSGGFLEALPASEGENLTQGQLLVRLADPTANARLAEVQARLEAARFALSTSQDVDPALAAKDREFVQHLEHEVAAREVDLARLEICTPVAGRVTRSLDEGELGRFVERGEAVATVAAGARVVRALLTEEDIAAARPEPGQRIQFRSASNPGRLLHGAITRVAPAGRREFDQEFTKFLDPADYAVNPATGLCNRSQFEIEAVLDSTDEGLPALDGMTGHLRLPSAPESIGVRLLRKTQTFIRRLTS